MTVTKKATRRTLGQLLIAARGDLSLAEAKELTGIDRGNLSRYERDIRIPTRANLERIAKGYGCDKAPLITAWTHARTQQATDVIARQAGAEVAA
jgi:transcriptional regulator with XRE-family HTH domain